MLSPADFIFNGLDKSQCQYFQSSFDYIYDPYAEDDTFKKDHSSKSFSEYVSYANVISGDLSIEDTYEFLAKLLFPHESLTGYSFLKSDIFIPGVRYISPGILVFERPPMHQVVSYTPEYRDNINEKNNSFDCYLPIPWQVYVAAYNPLDMRLINVRMYFSNSSLYSPDQPVYAPPLLNFYSNGELCRPFFPTTEDIEKYPQNISGIIASAYDWIWNSGFNLDITQNIAEYLYKYRYIQFEQYIKESNIKAHFDWLRNHPVRNVAERISSQYLSSFFKCWETVPLEVVSNFEWSPFSRHQFFYMDYNVNPSEEHLPQYLDSHPEIIVHEYAYEDQCHCEECCDEYCMTIEDILESTSFGLFLRDNFSQSNDLSHRTLSDAVLDCSKYLSSNRISQRQITNSSLFVSNFVNCGSLLSSSS